eukprot:jgi/Chlat1/2852/Chrsp194S00788
MEGAIAKSVREEVPWEQLPERVRKALVSKDAWRSKVKAYWVARGQRYPGTTYAKEICTEIDYYEELIRHTRAKMRVFPYHLADVICRVMRLTPFKYYRQLLYDVMKNESSYDTIPNFTAADALRLTGIGRNEFIEIMNKCRAKLLWKVNKALAKEYIPEEPIEFPMESWWQVKAVNFTLEEFKKLSPDELALIDAVVKQGRDTVGQNDMRIIRRLYRLGLVYLDVPMNGDDRISVPPLEYFVSNKNQSDDNATEGLLYAMFVASTERTTVAELAALLRADLGQLCAAASIACRLGFAKKHLDSLSPRSTDGADRQPFANGNLLDRDLPRSSPQEFAFVVDTTLTSFLLMGNLSAGVKRHAYTLFEVGKLADSSTGEFLHELDLMAQAEVHYEGEVKRFYDHAISLHRALKCLLHRTTPKPDVAQIASPPVVALIAVTADTDLISLSPPTGAQSAFEEDLFSLKENPFREDTSTAEQPAPVPQQHEQMAQSSERADVVPDGHTAGVEILRADSLEALPPAICRRMMSRDYAVVLAMAPLASPPLPIPPHLPGPAYFGSPAPEARAPWLRLLLYQAAGAGLPTLALAQGQRLRLLPPALAGTQRVLLCPWDDLGDVGGGKGEPWAVSRDTLLGTLNDCLRSTAVLAQPLPDEGDSDGKGHTAVHTVDVPLPLPRHDDDGGEAGNRELTERQRLSRHPAVLHAVDELQLQTCVGFIRMVRIGKTGADRWVPQDLQFGVPLFDPELCKEICDRAVRLGLFAAANLEKHRNAMANLRSRLLALIASLNQTWVDGSPSPVLDSNESSPGAEDSSSTDAPIPGFMATPDNTKNRSSSQGGAASNNEEEDVQALGVYRAAQPSVNLYFDGLKLAPAVLDRCTQGRLVPAILGPAPCAPGARRKLA